MTQNFPDKFQVPALEKAERIDKFLIRCFPKTSRGFWKDHLQSLIRIDGKSVKKGLMLRGSEWLEILAAPDSLQQLRPDASTQCEVLYEDPQLIAVNKSAGLPCYPLPAESAATVAGALSHAYPELLGFQAKPLEAGLIHRLDNETSGVLLFARSEENLAEFAALNRRGDIRKIYLAIVEGVSPAKGVVDSPIAHHRKNPRKMVSPADEAERLKLKARRAVTEYRRVKCSKEHSLLLLRIRKGQRHQIRVHLASIGHPIVGDKLYAKSVMAEPDAARHLLHARKVVFTHPLTRRNIAITAPLPADFSAAIQQLFD